MNNYEIYIGEKWPEPGRRLFHPIMQCRSEWDLHDIIEVCRFLNKTFPKYDFRISDPYRDGWIWIDMSEEETNA